jgi:hypothetical protein
VRCRLRLEPRPARPLGHVVDAHQDPLPHGVQAWPVVEPVLHLVSLCGQRVTAGDRHGPAVGPHRHAARHQAGGQQRKLLKELLDALGAKQCLLQFGKVARSVLVSNVFTHVGAYRQNPPRQIIAPGLVLTARSRSGRTCVNPAGMRGPPTHSEGSKLPAAAPRHARPGDG